MKRMDVVQIALDRLARLDAMQAEQDAERASLKAFLATADQLVAQQEPSVAEAVSSLALNLSDATPTPVGEIRKRAAAIIGAMGRPVPLAELHQSLVRAGVVVGGKDPRSNLSAKLSGADELQTIPGKGWIVKKEMGSAAGTAEPYLNGTAG